MESSRKLIVLVAVCALIATLCPLTTAQYGGGTGTAEDPYLIYTPEQMNEIGLHEDHWDKHFKLMADLDLAAYTGTQFNIIGDSVAHAIGRSIGITSQDGFAGVFDGNGHTVANFTYTSPDTDYVGLFVRASHPNAEIKNLGLIDPNVIASDIGALLVGSLQGGTLTNCYVQGGTVSGGSYIGGLVGYSYGDVFLCFWDIETSGQTTSDEGAGKTTAEMQMAATFVGWGGGIWTIDKGKAYPKLWRESQPGQVLGPDSYPA